MAITNSNYTTYFQATPAQVLGCSKVYLHLIEKSLSRDTISSYWATVANQGLLLSRISYDETSKTSVYTTTQETTFDSIFYISEAGDVLGYTSFCVPQVIRNISEFQVSISFNIEDPEFQSSPSLLLGLVGANLVDSNDKTRYISSSKLPKSIYGYTRFTENVNDQVHDSSISLLTDTGIITSDGKLYTVSLESGLKVDDFKHTYDSYYVDQIEGEICFYQINSETGDYRVVSLEDYNKFKLPAVRYQGILNGSVDYISGRYIVLKGEDRIYDIKENSYFKRGFFHVNNETLTIETPVLSGYPGNFETKEYYKSCSEWIVYNSLENDYYQYYINHFGSIGFDRRIYIPYVYSDRTLLLKNSKESSWYVVCTDNGVQVDMNPSKIISYQIPGYVNLIPGDDITSSALVDAIRHRPFRSSRFPEIIASWKGYLFYLENSRLYYL